jgi:hypothetical protein
MGVIPGQMPGNGMLSIARKNRLLRHIADPERGATSEGRGQFGHS